MTTLTPQEVLQAIADGKKLEYKWHTDDMWQEFDPLSNGIYLEHVMKGKNVFRLAQEMITIGDVSFPKPETKAPKEDQYYFIPDPTIMKLHFRSRWDNDKCDERRLKLGFVHLTEENAIAHAKALIILSGGNADE